ncbi:hypothetical protein BOQ62_01675 [Chryseobacterium sp. CH21]|nr:hypothetical protein BOQ62_01675 [Chryseobacterium sp. CH21]
MCIVACSNDSHDKERENFDISLLSQSSELQLSGEYEAFVRLNITYLKKAVKMNYRAGKGLCYLNMAGVNVSAGNYEKARFFSIKQKKTWKTLRMFITKQPSMMTTASIIRILNLMIKL